MTATNLYQTDAVDSREITPVIFRKWKDGDIIALFPADAGDSQRWYPCSSYMHVGQHGSADPNHVMQITKPATPAEYADLKTELESAPYCYRFKVCRRMTHKFSESRREQVRSWNQY